MCISDLSSDVCSSDLHPEIFRSFMRKALPALIKRFAATQLNLACFHQLPVVLANGHILVQSHIDSNFWIDLFDNPQMFHAHMSIMMTVHNCRDRKSTRLNSSH